MGQVEMSDSRGTEASLLDGGPAERDENRDELMGLRSLRTAGRLPGLSGIVGRRQCNDGEKSPSYV